MPASPIRKLAPLAYKAEDEGVKEDIHRALMILEKAIEEYNKIA